MNEAHSSSGISQIGLYPSRSETTAAASSATAQARPQEGGDPEGGIRIALGAAGKSCFEVWRAGGYAARTDFPRSLAIAWRSI